ncbi:MAG: hypothetical protein D6806_07650 [Deltaproteobacteria bacterium]|nr:MAG: hypothetical protein D6806_07650 [Deltaproteobacteria bacterium]
MFRQLQALKGMEVVALEEGRILGELHRAFLNTEKKKVSGITVHGSRFSGELGWVDVKDIVKVGEDVILVSRSAACRAKQPIGRSMQQMLGLQVATRAGKIIGLLVDLEVDEQWRVTEIVLSERRSVPVDKDAVFGQDAIILSADAASKVRRLARQRGLLARIFGRDAVDQAEDVISRVERSVAAPKVEQPQPPKKPASRAARTKASKKKARS